MLSNTKACLPPHHPYDCTTELLLGTTHPRNCIYPLSFTELHAMEEYIQEAYPHILSPYSPTIKTSKHPNVWILAKLDGPCTLHNFISTCYIDLVSRKLKWPLCSACTVAQERTVRRTSFATGASWVQSLGTLTRRLRAPQHSRFLSHGLPIRNSCPLPYGANSSVSTWHIPP